WRCLRCLSQPILYTGCCKDAHMENPLHRVEQWTGDFFAPSWLWQVGVQLHIGHGGRCCP
ncbi:hypothetical protein JAAARDRAFT_83368, partial [Jaapia argillacea MUCL 33604]